MGHERDLSAVSSLFFLSEYPCVYQDVHDCFESALWLYRNLLYSNVIFTYHLHFKNHSLDYYAFSVFKCGFALLKWCQIWSLCTWYNVWMNSNLFYIVCHFISWKFLALRCLCKSHVMDFYVHFVCWRSVFSLPCIRPPCQNWRYISKIEIRKHSKPGQIRIARNLFDFPWSLSLTFIQIEANIFGSNHLEVIVVRNYFDLRCRLLHFKHLSTWPLCNLDFFPVFFPLVNSISACENF
jgi:hypothetical protein